MSRESREETPTTAAKKTPLTPHAQAKLDTFLVRAYPGSYPEKEAAVKATIAEVNRIEAANNQKAANNRATSPKQETVAEKVSNKLYTLFGGIMPAHDMKFQIPENPAFKPGLDK
jgi:hypothetical protein